ncbi:MAG: hypothetical protein H7834_14390 [Magnetococcus sp. YQC-9]
MPWEIIYSILCMSMSRPTCPIWMLKIRSHPATLLLVDDDVCGNFSLARSLQNRVGKILMATDGATALKILRAHPGIDPGGDGYRDARAGRFSDHRGAAAPSGATKLT